MAMSGFGDLYDDLNDYDTEYVKAKNAITRAEDELLELNKRYMEEDDEVVKLSFIFSSEKQQLDLSKTELKLALSNKQRLEQEIDATTASILETDKSLERMSVRCAESERMIENELNVIEEIQHQHFEKYRKNPRCNKVIEADTKLNAANSELRAAKEREAIGMEKLNSALEEKQKTMLQLREVVPRLAKAMITAKKLRGKTRSVSFVTPSRDHRIAPSNSNYSYTSANNGPLHCRSLFSGLSLSGMKSYPTLKSRFQSHSLNSSLGDKDSFLSKMMPSSREITISNEKERTLPALLPASTGPLNLKPLESSSNRPSLTPKTPLKSIHNNQLPTLGLSPRSFPQTLNVSGLKRPEQSTCNINKPSSPITKVPEEKSKTPSLLQQTLIRQSATHQKTLSEKLSERTPVAQRSKDYENVLNTNSPKTTALSTPAVSSNIDIFGKSPAGNAAEDADEIFSLSRLCTDSSLFSPSGFTTTGANTGGDNNDMDNIFGFSPMTEGFGGPLF